MKRYALENIVWDVDAEEDAETLPESVELEIEGSGLEDLGEGELEEYGFSDWLSDRYGFCVMSFNWREIG